MDQDASCLKNSDDGHSKRYKDRLASASKEGAEAVQKIVSESELTNLREVDPGIVVDLFLSLRAVKAHDAMINLYDRMPLALQRAKMMREQLGFALNREGRFEEAERLLEGVIAEFGPSSETNGLLGRVYKDHWERAKQAGLIEASRLLKRAVDTYVEGFEADWRDPYPGVNAVTLMEMMDKPDPRQAYILPIVRYSASRKAKKNADYWDYETLLELAVLGRDPHDADRQLSKALERATASWEVDSAARNLRLVRYTRTGRGEDAAWIEPLEETLTLYSRRLGPKF